MKYSYKNGSSRPPSSTIPRNQLYKGLFSIQLLSSLRANKIVVNIDEWSFERSVKRNYSWLPTGQNWSILNEAVLGKWNLILASFSDGEWFAFIVKGTVDSSIFLLFLKILESLIWSKRNKSQDKYILLLDNASIHSSKLSKLMFSLSQLELRLLSAYAPELAPIELAFKAIKAKQKKQMIGQKADFSKIKYMKIIIKIIQQIKLMTWMQWWKTVIQKLRWSITDVLDLLNQSKPRLEEELKRRID